MSDDTGRTPSDEELAKIAWDAFLIYPDREDGNAVWGRDAHVREIWTKVASAVRAALEQHSDDDAAFFGPAISEQVGPGRYEGEDDAEPLIASEDRAALEGGA